MARGFATREEYDAFAGISEQCIVRFGEWTFDTVRLRVGKPGEIVRITYREGEVLNVLIDALPLPVRSTVIARKVMSGYDEPKVIIRRLRQKLGRERIETNAGGYQFVPFPEEK